jgi:hypothetical protein
MPRPPSPTPEDSPSTPLRARAFVPPPPAPRSAADARAALRLAASSSFAALVGAAQHELDRLGYNHSPGYHHPVDKRLPFKTLAARAVNALHDPAPIKCVEGVALALALTAGLPGVDRLALGFRSREHSNGKKHRHVVLALRDCSSGGWAAAGMSRRPDLLGGRAPGADLPSLSSLVARYASGYAAVGHVLEKVRVGFPAPHSLRCARRVSWRRLRLTLPEVAAAGGAAAAAASGEGEEEAAWRLVAAALDAFAACPGKASGAQPTSSPRRRDTDASLASTLSLSAGGGGGAAEAGASVLASASRA